MSASHSGLSHAQGDARTETFPLVLLGILTGLVLSFGCGDVNIPNPNNPSNPSDPSSASVLSECYTPGDSEAGTGAMGCGVIPSFGDPNADAFYFNEAQLQASFWNGVPANPVILNDCNGPNAYSTPDGFILYGANLFAKLAQSFGGDGAPLSGVLAHEWGHQVQFQGGWSTSTEPTQRPIELEADAFSGYYMALGPDQYPWQSILDYLDAVNSFGDFDFNSQSHHGTPQERVTAAQLGFQTAEQAVQAGIPLSYPELHQMFSTQIMSFGLSSVAIPENASANVKTIMSRIDNDVLKAMLAGKTRGENRVVRNSSEPKKLYPHW